MRALVDLVYPPSCLSCGARGHRFLCPGCGAATPRAPAGCDCCALPRAVSGRCARCRSAPPPFARCRAAVLYAGPARDALIAFKLGGERRAAGAIADRMAAVAGGTRARVVAHVPATRRVTAARGFDPAAELARACARRLRLPHVALLRKVRETADQASLPRAERLRNPRGAYVSRPVAGVVLLVDDILTTGATASACADALRRAGAAAVEVLVFARAD